MGSPGSTHREANDKYIILRFLVNKIQQSVSTVYHKAVSVVVII